MTTTMLDAPVDTIEKHFIDGFRWALSHRDTSERRVGAELKFPLVNCDGTAADYATVTRLWDYLAQRGWRQDRDPASGHVVGARKPGFRNDTVASCETGFCKPEFSLAHVGDLHDLVTEIDDLRRELASFCEQEEVRFLCYGIQPLSDPDPELLMKKGRTGVWNKVFDQHPVTNSELDPIPIGVHLFTVNAASHVHVSVTMEEAVRAVNVFNGLAGAQFALTANSSVWRGRVDRRYKDVAEKLWDWWMPAGNRTGIPERRFEDLADYVDGITSLKPVFVKRDGRPLTLKHYGSFKDYFQSEYAVGHDIDDRDVPITPREDDIELHNSCYWFNSRVSRYYTVENRTNDQQPPDDLPVLAALSLGLVSALNEAEEEVASHDWEDLRVAREAACRDGLDGRGGRTPLDTLAPRPVDASQTTALSDNLQR